MKNAITGIEKACIGPLFKPILIFEKILNLKLKIWILDFDATFWLAS